MTKGIIGSVVLFQLLFSIKATAQSPAWQWVQRGGGSGFIGSTPQQPGFDEIQAYAIDQEGNTIVGGRTTWYPTFDTIQFTSSVNWENANFFLAKYDKCGNVLWARVGGGDGLDQISGLDVDERGNIYTQGWLTSVGSPVYINTPNKDTTFNATCRRHFMKFDKDGNLLHFKGTATTQSFINGTFKRLKNGTFLTIYQAGGGFENVGNYTVPPRGRSFILLDSLGNVIKGALIDTTVQSLNTLGSFVMDENENIYFPFTNLTLGSVSILSTVLNPAPQYTTILVKTDTSFQVKDMNVSGYYQGALGRLSYSNGYLYGSGRNRGGALFDGDTTYTNFSAGLFTAVKIDTNLNRVWTSRPSAQTINPNHTNIFPGAGKDFLYLGFQNRGTTTWGSANLVTAPNTYNVAVLKLRTSDGVCVEGQFAGGVNSSDDLINYVGVDNQGNGHFLGIFTNSIGTFADTVLANGGASSPDYFILKWGLPCTDSLNSLDRPSAPDNLEATATGPQSIEVIWHNTAPYRQGFHLYRSPDGLGNWVNIATLPYDQYDYTDSGLNPNTAYWYRVAAFTGAGESGFSNIDSALTWASACSAAISRTNTDSVYTFQANPTGFGTLSYQWSINGTAFSTAASPVQTIGAPGTYSICVTVTDAAQCSATDCDTVVVVPFSCATVISYTANDTLYSFSNANTGTAPYTYQWSVNGNGFSTSAAPVLPLSMAGSFNVCVTVTDANQCQSTDCETIVISSIGQEQTLEVGLFPNPASEVVHISIGSSTDFSGQLTVTDMLGKAIVNETLKLKEGDVLHLPSAHWQPGIYVVQLQSPAARWSGKVVKY